VALGQEAGEVRVAEVVPDSIAAAAGVAAGDVVVQAAGAAVGSAQDLIGAVQRQAPGTWLPLVLKRDGRTVETVAKFPPQEAADSR
jgi:S1-C subfamily serine protease